MLTQPIHRYDDADAGIIDGAVFVFSTHGTNPDLLVLVEAQEQERKPARWRIAATRMTTGELIVRDGERELWSLPFTRFADNLNRNLDSWTFFYAKP